MDYTRNGDKNWHFRFFCLVGILVCFFKYYLLYLVTAFDSILSEKRKPEKLITATEFINESFQQYLNLNRHGGGGGGT